MFTVVGVRKKKGNEKVTTELRVVDLQKNVWTNFIFTTKKGKGVQKEILSSPPFLVRRTGVSTGGS